MPVRNFLRRKWHAITIILMVIAIACAALVILRGMPPHKITMAIGLEGGSYYEVGQRYQAALARESVQVELRSTSGSAENLAMLLDPHSGVSVAVVPSGIAPAGSVSELSSLGTIFNEPLWWFQRREVEGGGLESLRGRKISIGPEGSGTRVIALELLKRAGIIHEVGELLPLEPLEAGEKLLAGEVDVAFILASPDSPAVRQLLDDERIVLAGYPRADAMVALYPFLHQVVIPRGAGNFAKDRPPADVTLVATRASLVVRKELHPAIQYLLLNAAVQIHSGPSILRRPNEFPAAETMDIPLSSEALRFYKSGLPFLNDYFPFWLAALIGKLIVLLIPILGILYPLTRFLPRLYDWLMRSKVARIYGELRFLEDEIMIARSSGGDTHEMIGRLDRLEKQANHLRIPPTYASMLYMLRHHIELVRENLKRPTGG
jgi:TRAP transporter TAXI family solute receptor